ncbi:hypothetical protein COR50_22185 [Chitinophaga caeni]|uniref:DUF4440 domain-containing protein n=1 Tax=Chitinophaga caeni TaxID=2029983 RepID=A0A291R0N4_9BACT|nr:hypothetical protein [Chitinophaga caeni]ATL49663.1 hypothetical protein COR50_22185 [Chitinophaga caeni]
MQYEKITHPIAKAAIEAWQKADHAIWKSLCTEKVILLDDGKARDFNKFCNEAMGHERFTSIDKVENNGLTVYGKFHSDTWGDFKTYFKFKLDSNDKIVQLEIGQADY